MKVSDDQNTVTTKGITGVFVDGGYCRECCFYGKLLAKGCHGVCIPDVRNDGNTGNFKEVNTCK